jgi:hypothetical protein
MNIWGKFFETNCSAWPTLVNFTKANRRDSPDGTRKEGLVADSQLIVKMLNGAVAMMLNLFHDL